MGAIGWMMKFWAVAAGGISNFPQLPHAMESGINYGWMPLGLSPDLNVTVSGCALIQIQSTLQSVSYIIITENREISD